MKKRNRSWEQTGSIKDRHDTGEKAEGTKVSTWPGYLLMSLAILYRENVEVWRAGGAFKFMSFRERKSRADKTSRVSFCVWVLRQLKISLPPQTQSWWRRQRWWWKEAAVECNSWSSPEYPPANLVSEPSRAPVLQLGDDKQETGSAQRHTALSAEVI